MISVDFGEDVYGRSLEDDYAVSPTSGNRLVELVVTSLGTKLLVKITRHLTSKPSDNIIKACREIILNFNTGMQGDVKVISSRKKLLMHVLQHTGVL